MLSRRILALTFAAILFTLPALAVDKLTVLHSLNQSESW